MTVVTQNRCDPLTFHVVCCGDLDNLRSRHECAAPLIPKDAFTYADFPGATAEFPLFFYMKSGETISCYFRTIPDQVTVDGRTYPWAWTADNFTYPEFRGHGLSTRLQSQATQYLHSLGIGRGSVFSTDVTLHIFKKLGFAMAGYARRFVLVRSTAPLLRAHISRPGLCRLLQTFSNPVVGIATSSLRLWNSLITGRNVFEAQSSCTEPELQGMLDRLAGKRPVHFATNAQALAKKLEIAQRTGHTSLWAIRRRGSADSKGYAIVRERFQDRPLAERYRDFRLMTLMDFAFDEADSRAAAGLVGRVVQRFFQSDCDVLEIISNNRLINRAATRRGLLPVGKGMSFSYSVPAEWNWTPKMVQLENWPLTSFCGDAFSF